MHALIFAWAYLTTALFPPESLRRSVAVVGVKGVFGTVTPVLAMPSAFDGWMHIFQALAVLGVSTATFASICLDCLRKRREAIDAANRLDRNRELAMDYFRFRRAKKNKHQRRLQE